MWNSENSMLKPEFGILKTAHPHRNSDFRKQHAQTGFQIFENSTLKSEVGIMKSYFRSDFIIIVVEFVIFMDVEL